MKALQQIKEVQCHSSKKSNQNWKNTIRKTSITWTSLQCFTVLHLIYGFPECICWTEGWQSKNDSCTHLQRGSPWSLARARNLDVSTGKTVHISQIAFLLRCLIKWKWYAKLGNMDSTCIFTTLTAWTTREIFRKYLRKFDLDIQRADRKMLLLLDNFSGHQTDYEPTNIEICYLLPYTTSHI